MMNGLQARDRYWDVVKGVLIILVILGHLIQYGVGGDYWHHPLFKAIYIFHMPLFMIISGYFSWSGVHQSRSWPIKRIRQLLLPCMTVSFVVAVSLLLRGVWFSDETCMVEALKRCTYSPENPSLWYVCVLLECSIFAWVMFRFRRMWWRAAWVILPVVVALLIPLADGIFLAVLGRLFPCGGYFLFLWPFFLIGLMLRRVEAQRWLSSPLLGLTVPLSILCWIFYCKADYVYITSLSLEAHSWWPSLFRFFSGVVGSFAVLYLLKWSYSFLKGRVWLVRTGEVTMAIYVLQDILWSVAGPGIAGGIVSQAEGHAGLVFILISLMTILLTAACYYLYMLMRRNRGLALCLFGETRPR